MKKFLFFSLILISALQLQAQLSWQSLPVFPGPARNHAIGFSHGSKGYVVTGVGTVQYKDFWKYDTVTNAWTQLPDYPGPVRSYGIGAVVNDTAYIGLGYSGSTDLNDWWAYDFSTSTWTQKNNNPMPPRHHPTAITLNGKIYVGMGDDAVGTQFADWWEYNPVTDSWIQKSNYPGPTMHHPVSAADNNLVYLSEGHLSDATNDMGSKKLYSYNPLTDSWTMLADMPGPGVVAGASFYLPNNKVYSGCGITEPIETFHNEFYEYDISTGVWDTIANYPGTGNFSPVYFTIGNSGYVATGASAAVSTKDFYRLAPFLPLDAGIISLNVGPSCGNILPVITLKNFGMTTLTSCTINYKVDNNTIQTQNWTGSLISNASTTITLPSQTIGTIAAHTFTCFVSNPNGLADPNACNDQLVQSFINFSSVTAGAPLTEGFVSTTFPPAGWLLSNPDAGTTWARKATVGGFGNSTSCAWMDFFNYAAAGESDYLYSPPIDFTSLSGTINMTFSVAYARYDNIYCDGLAVDVSTDCGSTWTTLYSKSCSVLETSPAAINAFTPTSTQWRSDTVNLSSFAGNSDVIVRFKAMNGYGNNLYIDDINIGTTIGINELHSGFDLTLYPNPASNNLLLDLNFKSAQETTIELIDLNGRILLSRNAGVLQGEIKQTIDVSGFAKGTYLLRVITENDTQVKKIIVN